MVEYRTNLRHRYNHPDIVVAVSEDLGPGFEWVLSYFEETIAKGGTFQEGQIVQMGWMLISLRSCGPDVLEVWEPRLDVFPIHWTRGASSTIRHLVTQKEMCAQVGVEPVFPTLRQSGVVSEHFLSSNDFCMERELPRSDTDSGWFFKEASSAGGRHSSLFEIAVARPEVIPFLALPALTSVVYSGSAVTVVFERRSVSSLSNAFLARLVG
jgi:hypothetical protein